MLPRFLLVLSAFLVNPVGVAEDTLELERAHPLYPLKAGNRWNSIEKTLFNGEIKKRFEEVTGIVKFDEFTCAKVQTSESDFTYIMVKDDGALYRVGGQDQNDTFTYEPHWCVLKPIRKETQTWDYEYRPISMAGLGPNYYQVMRGRAAQFQEQIEYEGNPVDATGWASHL